MSKRKLVLAASCVGGALVAGIASQASATTLYDSGGFETTAGYTSGAYLVGQPSIGPVGSEWTGGSPDATVEAQVATYSPTAPPNYQYVAISDGSYPGTYATAGDAGYFYPGTYTASPYSAGTSDITVSWTEAYAAGAVNSPFFGVVVFNGANEIAGFGADASTNEFVGYGGVSGTPSGEFTSVGNTLSTGTFGTYAIVMHYSNDTFDVYYNGNKLDSVPYSFISSATAFTDADLASFQEANVNEQFYGFGYFDNYLVTATPEPTSLAVLAGAAGMFLMRRRRKLSQ